MEAVTTYETYAQMGEYQRGYYVNELLGGRVDSTDVTSQPRNKCGSRSAQTTKIYLLKGKAAAPLQAWTGLRVSGG
jgi:hypothetical protein